MFLELKMYMPLYENKTEILQVNVLLENFPNKVAV